jgi:hypothetical protein
VVRNADLGILHSLYNQAPKKVFLYEKQYISPVSARLKSYFDAALLICLFHPQLCSVGNEFAFYMLAVAEVEWIHFQFASAPIFHNAPYRRHAGSLAFHISAAPSVFSRNHAHADCIIGCIRHILVCHILL